MDISKSLSKIAFYIYISVFNCIFKKSQSSLHCYSLAVLNFICLECYVIYLPCLLLKKETYKFAFCFFSAFSMASPALLMRVVASAYSVAEKAATIVRNVMAAGDLAIVEKVLLLLCSRLTSLANAELDKVKVVFLKISNWGRKYSPHLSDTIFLIKGLKEHWRSVFSPVFLKNIQTLKRNTHHNFVLIPLTKHKLWIACQNS